VVVEMPLKKVGARKLRQCLLGEELETLMALFLAKENSSGYSYFKG
jgi:hypothetical protein